MEERARTSTRRRGARAAAALNDREAMRLIRSALRLVTDHGATAGTGAMSRRLASEYTHQPTVKHTYHSGDPKDDQSKDPRADGVEWLFLQIAQLARHPPHNHHNNQQDEDSDDDV